MAKTVDVSTGVIDVTNIIQAPIEWPKEKRKEKIYSFNAMTYIKTKECGTMISQNDLLLMLYEAEKQNTPIDLIISRIKEIGTEK